MPIDSPEVGKISYGEGNGEGPDRRHHLSNPGDQREFDVKGLARRVIGDDRALCLLRMRETGDKALQLRSAARHRAAVLFGLSIIGPE